MKILQICAFTGPYQGNFIKSLIALEEKAKDLGYETIYAFPLMMKDFEWCRDLAKDHKMYYLPVAKARILPKTYYTVWKIYHENPDLKIVHSHFELYDIPVSLFAPKGVKVFWHLHDTLAYVLQGSRKYLWKAQYTLFSRNTMLIAVSDILKETAIKIGFKKENAYSEANGIDTGRIKRVETDRETSTEFLMFGKLRHIKGVDLAEAAIRKVGKNISLLVVGGNSSNDDIAGSYTIKAIPTNPDVNSLYSSTRCFVHVSRTEGLSYALLESLYSGLPVIVSDIPENSIAKEFPTAFMVKNEDSNDIARAMDDMYKRNFHVSEEEVERSRQIIEDKYSMESWARRIINNYMTLNLK